MIQVRSSSRSDRPHLLFQCYVAGYPLYRQIMCALMYVYTCDGILNASMQGTSTMQPSSSSRSSERQYSSTSCTSRFVSMRATCRRASTRYFDVYCLSRLGGAMRFRSDFGSAIQNCCSNNCCSKLLFQQLLFKTVVPTHSAVRYNSARQGLALFFGMHNLLRVIVR